MNVISTEIPEVLIIEPTVYGDERGFFMESFNAMRFSQVTGLDVTFVQDNHSRSARNVLRGLHFQAEHPQGKLVRVVRGSVFDVAVDIRRDSNTFMQWVGIEISEDNKRELWIPPGFAHGFFVMSESADFLYKTTSYYSPADERCIAWNDPDLSIRWPVSTEIILSKKDMGALTMREMGLWAV